MPRGIRKDGSKLGFQKGHSFGFQKGCNPPIRAFQEGHIPWNKGKKGLQKHSEETRRKIGEIEKGENNSSWKGGITPDNQRIRNNIEARLWREAVFARDNFTCQKYGTKGGELRAHHILNFAQYPELRTSIENGITLSEKAHKEFHRIYSNRNNTREQLEEFLKV